MKSHTFFRCICVLGMLRAVTLRSLLDISGITDDNFISMDISSNNLYYEYYEGEQMSFNCTMRGGKNERKANITFSIGGDLTKEFFGVRQVAIERDAEAFHNDRLLSCVIRYEGTHDLLTATRLITVYYSPRVADKDLDVNGKYIATSDFKVGQGAYLKVRFQANPRPYMAEWKVNGNELDANRFTPLTTDNFSYQNAFWVAALRIEKVEESDFDDEFQLDVTNEYGYTIILIRLLGKVSALTDISDSWLHILALVGVAVGLLSIVAYFVWRHKNQSTSKDNCQTIQDDKHNSVEDSRTIHQSATTPSTKFYIPQCVKHQEKFCKSCYELANEVISSEIAVAIVEGASGMGKTRYLEEIQNIFRSKKPQLRIVNLNMRIFCEDFTSKLSSTSEAVTLVASKLQLSKKEQQVFENMAREERRVLYLFDDVDCTENFKLEIVLEFFQLLHNVITTTRKPLTVTQPNVKTYNLQLLDDHQQGEFMEKLGCSKSMRQEIKTIKRDFYFGVPLYLLMIAQNALTDVKLPKEFFLTDIYKTFMDNRVEKVLGEKNELHKTSKMEAILHNQAILSAFHEESKQEDELGIRVLALTSVINGCTYFTNISIAEYLVASALVKKLYDLPDSVNILIPKIYKIKLLVSDDFSTERRLANNIILHLKLHSATIHVSCSNFVEDLECCKSELATTIIKERLFSLHKELARNGLRLDFDQRLQLGKGKETFPVIWTAMEAASDLKASSTSSELFRFLTESSASLDSVDDKGDTALSIAIKASNEPLVKFLLELGATMKLVHNYCLHLAAETGNLPLVEFFSSHYEVDVVNSEGVTPLMLAAFEGNLQVVQFLISKGSNVNLEAANGSTSLHYAAQGGHVEVLKVLVTKENVDYKNRNLKTPLMFSVEEGKVEAVKHLLSAGADATKVDKEQNSCLHMAADNGWLEVVRMFAEDEETKTLLNYPNRDGRTALHLSADYGHEEIVRYLLDKGADPEKKDNDGNTPYILATDKSHTNVG